jgi:hypothetical protein
VLYGDNGGRTMQMPNDDNSGNNQDNDNRPKFKAGYLYLIALVVIGVFIFFFVNQYKSTSTVKYYDADMTSEKNADGTYKGKLYDIINNQEVDYLNVENHTTAGYLLS